MIAKPVLKWAGGKTQLLNAIEENLPIELTAGKIKKYFEPFIGGGAVFFHLSQKYNFSESFISDINPELILVYKTIKNMPYQLIDALTNLQNIYISRDKSFRDDFFYKIREDFNKFISQNTYEGKNDDSINRAAQVIFLNRTCYNGLFRVNSKGEFNVPHGRYKNPKICDKENILEVSRVLLNTTIVQGDFESFTEKIDKSSFVYFDPPYRPLSESSSFTSYSSNGFNENEQLRLVKYFRFLNKREAKLMLSNSDPSNIDKNESDFDKNYFEFFQKEFLDFGFEIIQVDARRNINSKGNSRGVIKELLIKNY